MSHGNRGGADCKAPPARLTPAEIEAHAQEAEEFGRMGIGVATIQVDAWILAMLAAYASKSLDAHYDPSVAKGIDDLLHVLRQAGMVRTADAIKRGAFFNQVDARDLRLIDRRASELAAQRGMGRN